MVDAMVLVRLRAEHASELATKDAEIASLRTELAEARAERDAAIAALPSEAALRTLRDALPLRGMSDYVRQDALRIVSRMEDAIRAHAAGSTGVK